MIVPVDSVDIVHEIGLRPRVLPVHATSGNDEALRFRYQVAEMMALLWRFGTQASPAIGQKESNPATGSPLNMAPASGTTDQPAKQGRT